MPALRDPGTTCALHAIWPVWGGVAGIAGVVPAVATVTFSCTTKGGSGAGGVLVTLVKVPVMCRKHHPRAAGLDAHVVHRDIVDAGFRQALDEALLIAPVATIFWKVMS